MEKIRICHIDDAPEMLVLMEAILRKLPNVAYCGNADNAVTALELVERVRPDILFADIEMPGASGLELAERIQHLGLDIVFLTSHKKFALDALQTHAFGYLLKPPRPDDVRGVILDWTVRRNSILNSLRSEPDPELPEPSGTGIPKRLLLPMVGTTLVLSLDDIVLIEARSNYSIFTMRDGKQHTSGRVLKTYADYVLPHPDFLRVHRSYVVNKNFVSGIHKNKSGGLSLELTNGRKIETVPQKKEELLASLMA